MISNQLTTGSSLSSYLDSLLEKARGAKADANTAAGEGTGSAATSAAQKRLQNSAQAALETAGRSFKATTGQRALEAQQASLAGDLRTALNKAGIKLEGAVEFSLDSQGALSIQGSSKDQAAVRSFLAADTSKPAFASRLSSLAQGADALSGTIRQSAAISQAARMASGPSGVMSLYASLAKQQDSHPAVFSLSGTQSGLSYPGMLASQA